MVQYNYRETEKMAKIWDEKQVFRAEDNIDKPNFTLWWNFHTLRAWASLGHQGLYRP